MTRKPKQIVIDKDAFIGIDLDTLCEFAKHHFVLVSDTLLYECATATKQNPKVLLQRHEELVKSGAYCCSMSRHFAEWEGWRCQPYPALLADRHQTIGVRNGSILISRLADSDVTRDSQTQRTQAARGLFAHLSARAKAEIDSRVEDVHNQVRRLSNAPHERLSTWLAQIDKMDIHGMAGEAFLAGWIRIKSEFCLSPSWVTWQHLRLIMVNVYEYWYCLQTGGPRDNCAEHDYQDVEYALLLSRAGGIITRDKRLARIVKAAFPEKGVFSSPKKVPASYRWDGTGV